ncbi:PriCT-2 domain-containing protein [Alphaproteobacteria bacterium]|nr:PriCT-2 domain-containing protein [Alphaproteobacteria bacterium]
MADELLGFAPKRIGKAPRYLLAFRCTEPMEKKTTDIYEIGGGDCQVEILGEGQQFVAEGIHPDTKSLYTWPSDSLIDYNADELPAVTTEQVNNFLEQAERVLARYGPRKGRITSNGTTPRPSLNLTELDGKMDEIEAALDVLPNNDEHYDDWVTMLHAIKGAVGEDGYDLAHRWSQKSNKYDAEKTDRRWNSIKNVKSIGAGTIFYLAEEAGFDLRAFRDRKPEPTRIIGRSLAQINAVEIIDRPQIHPLIPNDFTLFCGGPKQGKSKITESATSEIITSETLDNPRVLYVPAEYDIRMTKDRFGWMPETDNLNLIIQGEMPRFDEGGAEKLAAEIEAFQPAVVIIDTLVQFKRLGDQRGYEAETVALSEIKKLMNAADVSCVVIHHARKNSINDSGDIFERILGSTGLAAVPDNLMMLETVDGLATIHTKGRSIPTTERRFELRGNVFSELTEPGAMLVGYADKQAEILNLLGNGPLLQNQIAAALDIDKGNVSKYCAKLERQRMIRREGRGQPWQLAGKELFADGDP